MGLNPTILRQVRAFALAVTPSEPPALHRRGYRASGLVLTSTPAGGNGSRSLRLEARLSCASKRPRCSASSTPSPHFAEVFTVHLLTRNSRVGADLADHLFNSSEKRLARALLLLANFGKEGTPEPITAKISQAMLAEMIGTTRSRVSYFMNRFRKLGFIEYNGRIRVHKTLLNVILHD